jgi:N-acetylglutamate synthase-like GNAT family acetyltransferase
MKMIPFKAVYQPLVDQMLIEIQQEFDEPFTSSASIKMKDANKVIGTRFWVLMDGAQLAGTVGVIKMKHRSCALKSLFIPLKYRGGMAARLLLDRVIKYAREHKINTIYLGTMRQMEAAQKFYSKNGFIQIEKKDLPTDFPANILDTVFYRFQI